MPEATLSQLQIDRQKAIFIAKGGKIETVKVKESGEVIAELKSRFKTRTIEEWTKTDTNRMKEKRLIKESNDD
jgi:hypothetical protein